MDPDLAAAIEAELEPAMQAMGVSDVRASFYRLVGALDSQIWIAADLGLIVGSSRVPAEVIEGGTVLDGGGWEVELCPWSDVVNPEVSVETIRMGSRTHVRSRLLIQLPRVDILGDGEDLAPLVAAIMLAKAH